MFEQRGNPPTAARGPTPALVPERVPVGLVVAELRLPGGAGGLPGGSRERLLDGVLNAAPLSFQRLSRSS